MILILIGCSSRLTDIASSQTLPNGDFRNVLKATQLTCVHAANWTVLITLDLSQKAEKDQMVLLIKGNYMPKVLQEL